MRLDSHRELGCIRKTASRQTLCCGFRVTVAFVASWANILNIRRLIKDQQTDSIPMWQPIPCFHEFMRSISNCKG